MKKITGLVVILAVLVLGGYYGMGVITERTVKNNLDVVNKTNGLFADVVEYDRGWFKSQASLDWRLHVPEHMAKTPDGQNKMEPAQNYQMQMPLTIYHGPFIFADNGLKFGLGYAQTNFDLPAKYSEQFNALFTAESTKPTLDVSLLVNYFNTSKITMSVPQFKLIAKQGGQFDWMGMDSHVNVSSSMNEISGNFTIDGMRFAKDQQTADIGSISSNYNMHRTDKGLYLGDASISLPSIMIKKQDQVLFELQDFNAQTDSDISGGLLNSNFKSSIDKIVVNGKTYGPGMFAMSIRNLDADALVRINELASKAQQGTDIEKQQAMLAIMPELPKLLSRGAVFEVSDMNFNMPEGTIEGNVKISLPESNVSNPFEMMQKIQGNGKLKVPAPVLKQIIAESVKQKVMKTAMQQAMQASSDPSNAQPVTLDQNLASQVAEQTDKQINAMVQSGVLVENGKDYVVEITLNQGKLTVNGQAFNPAMLKF
ncbi:YdgA family protein [Legionella spiritensis]|uniref:Putative membrane protein YdgA-like protein n=1 Tax=Legionella spiritensis TaxID=452 RepID=A0A0W0Z6C7_LEGSP|nr:YdgA family protein [Legionella spiritensis]KTD64668.1 putative membrane protein YdgA-like protein [Legionella spiritensis]SNV47793.1 putative membrane protein YdgA-like protein [Legionella spiritensis]VEG91348.1 putative membrane protein YdgA-like protein [Legionella spiritensis]